MKQMDIKDIVVGITGVSWFAIKSKQRDGIIVFARSLWVYLSTTDHDSPLYAGIADEVGINRSSVYHCRKKIKELIVTKDKAFYPFIQKAEQEIFLQSTAKNFVTKVKILFPTLPITPIKPYCYMVSEKRNGYVGVVVDVGRDGDIEGDDVTFFDSLLSGNYKVWFAKDHQEALKTINEYMT